MGQRDLANCEIIMEQLILKVLLLLENDGNYNGGNVCLNHCGWVHEWEELQDSLLKRFKIFFEWHLILDLYKQFQQL